MNCLGFRRYFPLIFLAVSGGVSAVGLGELRGHPQLGERSRLELEILNAERLPLDATCFRLVQPSGSGDLPWLKKAGFRVRAGVPKILEIRPETPLLEPILELAVYLGCGYEVSRQYVLLVSPASQSGLQVVESRPGRDESVPRSTKLGARLSSSAVEAVEAPPRLMPRRMEKRTAAKGKPDRLMVSAGIDVGEPSLRLATELFAASGAGGGAKETQREILRLEFRMLMALNEQATSQMATAEKLRNMETTLGELQQRAAEFALRVEQSAQPQESPAPKSETLAEQKLIPATEQEPVRPVPAAARPVSPVEASPGLSEWSLYGVLLGVLLGLGGWLGWKNYRERQRHPPEKAFRPQPPESAVDKGRADESDSHEAVDLPVEPVAAHLPTRVDLELDGGDSGGAMNADTLWKAPRVVHDPAISISATMVDEHFEANPVMELADIMLSFGRVKGAAQALQEYIDNNPQEALQPWIRLMDVYRMAGMRAEFETVARNLNQNFNVEVQQWEAALPTFGLGDAEAAPLQVESRPESLEDMPRIAGMVCELWPDGDVVGYLYQLLRDNRGGKRVGFSLPVVDEILFLIELKETSNRIE